MWTIKEVSHALVMQVVTGCSTVLAHHLPNLKPWIAASSLSYGSQTVTLAVGMDHHMDPMRNGSIPDLSAPFANASQLTANLAMD